MYQSIVVPLDGSTFAEHALPAAVAIAGAHGAKLTLARAWDPANYHYSTEFAPELPDVGVRERLAATEYLNAVASRVRGQAPVQVDIAFLVGSVTEAIHEHVERERTDLIVMATHGMTGLQRAWIGSVADAIVRTVTAPVLLCRPGERPSGLLPGKFACVLLPLDGSSEAEQVLQHAADIGGDSRYVLLRVVRPVMTPLHPYSYVARATETDHAATDREVTSARVYLDAIAAELTARHPNATVDVDVRVGEGTGREIIDAARDYHADLVALTTHARRAVRLVLGSVADKVLRGTHGSVLLLRPTPVHRSPHAPTRDRIAVSGDV